ncbi:FMN-binding negative transcriptional regulator [Aquimarina sp. U1-2]|uniref:FMN-binding negative transcriptional regulator n=1 Tax=Aquimarina sp. U1-2 TaxID=2823141 RepID=UPI001AECFFBB|nr:FMN-binding negative transcriptional regulator [Aquimarina sp. U1-2]MBP2830967.1 FMN-binding negative transcriptional regulator [Aquimarina sp. U1-2]
MYPPPYHQDHNLRNSEHVARTYPLATIISAKNSKSFVTHAPLIFHDHKLVGHIDANNPHVDLLKDDHTVCAVFQGPQTYISPSIYHTKQLPTWNYIIAHATGITKEIKDQDVIKNSMVVMTAYLESPDYKFKLDINDKRMDRLIPYIHCFEIEVQHWEGKFKLSQDKTPTDIENAKQELIRNNQKSIADFVNTMFEKHF